MTKEYFTVVALPYSKATEAVFHVSLFVSPDLIPDEEEGKLGDFSHFLHWAALLQSGAMVELFDQQGIIPAQPILDQLSPGIWDAVFPPDTPVRRRNILDWSRRHWRTFRAAEVHNAAKLMHLAAMYTAPTVPPAPSVHPLGRLMGKLGVKLGMRRQYDESVFTSDLDQVNGETGSPLKPSPPLSEIESTIERQEPLRRLVLELHRARRFYERPESIEPYLERPVDGLARSRPPKPNPDFHERCSLLGDHPSLQRYLGLVLDLKVKNPAQLTNSQWLSARIIPRGDQAACRTMRTQCITVGDDQVTVAKTDDWDRGRLRLGDEKRFAVLDLDPDGSALKLDRYIWTFPRLIIAEQNGNRVHAAPSALRSTGFTVVRNQKALNTQDRLNRQNMLQASPGQGASPLLNTEDVTQGMRIEVWDNTAKAWFSLHSRRIEAKVMDHGVVLTNTREEGFIQGTTATETINVENSPIHVHESMFGWDGWSLSAPRPGKRIRHHEGKELVEDPDVDLEPITPLLVKNKTEPGSLPRLRYGRSYAFRAWAVDLAGNNRSHSIGPVPPCPSATVASVSSARANIARTPDPAANLIPILRSETAALAMERRLAPIDSRAVELSPEQFMLLSEPEINREVLRRLRTRRLASLSTAAKTQLMKADRATLVARSFAESISDEQKPFIADTVILDSELLARIAEVPPELDPSLLPGLLSTVTPLRPFLRWNPVQPPAVVSRHRFTIGESLRQLVIRSGVTQDLETLQIIVTSSEAYADEYVHLGYRQTSERHVVPPKTSFSEAELHGAFDAAIGSNDLDDQRKQLAVALRESGTLFDIDVPRLDDPSQREPQNGIKLVSDPQVPASVLKELPLPPGTMPAPGQYVIHDTDLLVLPYLPDVVARGISLVFPEAGRDRQIIFPFGTEGLSVDYEGTWPERHPFRLVLANSPQLHGSVAGNVVRIGLPPGDIQRFRLSSSLHRADLNLFGLWLSLPETLRQNKDVIEAATDGWLWAFTPFEEVTLVHAVPRPLEAPRPITLRARRPGEGETDAVILGAVDVHGPSTEMLTAEASWIDPVDDLSLPAPEDRTECGMAFKTPIRAEEDLAVLYGGSEDARVNVPGAGPVWLHSAIHRLNDTRHRTIRYRFRASTRFREYFDAETLRPANSGGAVSSDPNHPVDDGQSVVGPLITVSVPSSAKPAAPIVHSVLPLFRWDEGTEPEQPVAVRHRRRTGVRIYLERPWYSSGEDELLGVLLAPAGNDAYLDKLVSQWGSDPVWLGAPVNRRAMYLELDNLLRAIGFDDRPNDALPVVPPANLPLAAHPKSPTVTVLGYRPLYSAERHMWYVDVAIDPGSTFWPFVRLAVVRYQPNSIPGCHLSAPVLCDFVQLTPERTTSVSRTDLRHIRVVVSGPVGFRDRPSGIPKAQLSPLSITEMAEWAAKNRKVVARLQRRDPIIDTDLGWENVTAVELTIKGYGRNSFEASWVGELEAPEDLPLRRPGENPDWRITVEEWERLAGDPADLYVEDDRSSLVWEQRLVYADEIGL